MRAVCAFKGMWVLQECSEVPYLGCKEPWASPEGWGAFLPSLPCLSGADKALGWDYCWEPAGTACTVHSREHPARRGGAPSLLQVPEI